MYSRLSSFQTLTYITLGVCALSGGFLFLTGSHVPKYVIWLLCLLIFIHPEFRKQTSPQVLVNSYKDFIIPWLPWYFSILILVCFFNGVPESQDMFNAFLILSCIYLALSTLQLTRQLVIIALAFSLLLSTSAIDIQMLTVGFIDGNDVISVNKNKVLGVTSTLTVCCFGSLLLEPNVYGKKTKLLIILSTITSLCSIILTEVRTAIIPFIVLVPYIYLFGKKNIKSVSIAILIPVILLVLSFLTGRMQQGISDLQEYQAGNSYSSWGIRLELWKLALRAFWDAPFIGWGHEPFAEMIKAGHEFGVEGFKVYHFHNDFFNALTAGGLLEVVCWFATIALMIKKNYKDHAVICLLIGYLSVGLTERYWFHRITLFAFVAIWALLNAAKLKCVTPTENNAN